MASLARLELTTYCLEGNCSIRLSYKDKFNLTAIHENLYHYLYYALST